MTRAERWQAIEAAALALIDAIDDNLDNRPWPWKYAVPWKEATALRDVLRTPVLLDLSGRVPRD